MNCEFLRKEKDNQAHLQAPSPTFHKYVYDDDSLISEGRYIYRDPKPFGCHHYSDMPFPENKVPFMEPTILTTTVIPNELEENIKMSPQHEKPSPVSEPEAKADVSEEVPNHQSEGNVPELRSSRDSMRQGKCRSLSVFKDDSKTMYNMFQYLNHVDLIRVSNTCTFWRQILRDSTLPSNSPNSKMNDLYERECKRLWPKCHDVSRYPTSKKRSEEEMAEDGSVEKQIKDEDDDNIVRKPSILDLDIGGYREMILDNNKQNELFPLVYLEVAKIKRSEHGKLAEMEQAPLLGRIEIKLKKDKSPLVAENFRCLCTGEMGLSKSSFQIPLYFKGASFHKAIQSTLIQGGDIVYSGTKGWWQAMNENCPSAKAVNNVQEGYGSESIYGQTFADDHNDLSHSPGSLSSSNRGENTNGCQFMICVDKCKDLDGKHVVFGEVTKGIEVVRMIEHEIMAQKPPEEDNVIFIQSCGQIGFTGLTFEQLTAQCIEEERKKVVKTHDSSKASKTCQIL